MILRMRNSRIPFWSQTKLLMTRKASQSLYSNDLPLKSYVPGKYRAILSGTHLGRFFVKRWKFLIFWEPIEVKFCTAKRPTCQSAMPSFTWTGATSRRCAAKKLIFGLCVNLIPAASASRIPAGVKHHIFAPTAGARCTIFPKLCTMIELVVPIEKMSFIFRSNV